MPAPADVTTTYRGALAATRTGVLTALGSWWNALDPDDLDGSFRRLSPAAVQAVGAGQARAAALAPRYLEAYLGASGVDSVQRQPIAAAAFIGRTVDGRQLTDALYTGVIETKRRIGLGQTVDEARAAGLTRIGRAVSTELADASRECLTGAMLLDPHVTGYRRSVRLPACGRCIVLAGKRYRIEAAFDRHPRCDCVNEPALDTDNGPDGDELFARMSTGEQDAALGRRTAERVRAGEVGLNAAVNASTRKGGVSSRKPAPERRRLDGRPTPLDIRLAARGDADAYRDGLDEAGYLLNRVERPAPAPVAPAPAAPSPPAPAGVAAPADLGALTDDQLAELVTPLSRAGDDAGLERVFAELERRDNEAAPPPASPTRADADLTDDELTAELRRAYDDEDADLAERLGAEADRRAAAAGDDPWAAWDDAEAHTSPVVSPDDWQTAEKAADDYLRGLGVKVESAAERAARLEARAAAARKRETTGRRADKIRAEYGEYVQRAALDAETATRGFLLRPGTAAAFRAKYGSTDALFSGPARVAHHYASEELLNYWRNTPRMTLAQYARAAGDRSASTLAKASKADSAFEDGYTKDRRDRQRPTRGRRR